MNEDITQHRSDQRMKLSLFLLAVAVNLVVFSNITNSFAIINAKHRIAELEHKAAATTQSAEQGKNQ